MSAVIEVANTGVSDVFNAFLKKIMMFCGRCFRVKKTVSLALVGDKKMRELNKKYRRKNKVTDVLAFGDWEEKDFLGELIICLPQARRQAKQYGVSVKQELARLVVHGFLHLTGFDHERSKAAAKKMFGLQEKILCSIGKKCGEVFVTPAADWQ